MQIRWANVYSCPHCYAEASKRTRRFYDSHLPYEVLHAGEWRCRRCNRDFEVTEG